MCTFFVFKGKYFIIIPILCMLVGVFSVMSVGANLRTSTEIEDGVVVPILMYHSILKDPSRAGKYVVSPQTLEEDLIYLKKHGYTTVVGADLVDYIERGKALPTKPVMITFDDGHLNNLTYALPIFEKLDMCGVVCIVGKYCEEASASDDHNPSYAYLSWEEIKMLRESGRIEIANHSYDMHSIDERKGASIKRGENSVQYMKLLHDDLNKTQVLLKENCDIAANAFSYPYGMVSENSLQVVREMGFKLSYGCTEKVNYITDSDSLFCLGRFNRPSGIPTAEFMKRICAY